MKIAMLGTRGIPAGYSGFETAVEELSTRLVQWDHEVVVYCRKHMIDFEGDSYKSVKLVKLPSVANKHFDTFVHTGISTAHMLLKDRCDVALYFIAGNSPYCYVPRIFGIPTAINVDGLDSQRAKWSGAAKRYLRFAERLATRSANEVIADSRVIQQHYRDKFGSESVFIPYGAEMKPVDGSDWLDRFELEERGYILFVGRLVPENCAHTLIEAYNRLDTEKKLVIVGDAPYADDYIRQLKTMAGDGVIFTGYVFGDGYRQLSLNAHIMAVPTIVGGTHPVLVEALAAGNCIVTSNHPPNLETIGDAGVSFDADRGAEDLRDKLRMLLDDPGLVEDLRGKASRRAAEYFNWDTVARQYEELCERLVKP